MPTASRLPGIDLAYEFLDGAGPVIAFCPGYASDMQGSKALALEGWCRAHGRAMLRFDYAGHGRSGGRFIDYGIGDWAADASFIIDHVAGNRGILLVGSSMGGWISLLLAGALGARLKGMLLIAPAPDFSEELIRPALDPHVLKKLENEGVIYQPSQYGDPTPLSWRFMEEGAKHRVLAGPIPARCPVRILHGMMDPDVPWRLSLRLTEKLESQDVLLVYVKDGDHRLSRPADILLLTRTLAALLGEDGA